MSESSSAATTTEDRPELKRVMGPGLLLLFVVGDILGTGVYALTGKVAGEVGGAVWLPFLCAFVVAMLTVLVLRSRPLRPAPVLSRAERADRELGGEHNGA
jgi:Kef-type K+ transport system membrane component KefB